MLMSLVFLIRTPLRIDIPHLQNTLELPYRVRKYQALNNTLKKSLTFCAGATTYISPFRADITYTLD